MCWPASACSRPRSAWRSAAIFPTIWSPITRRRWRKAERASDSPRYSRLCVGERVLSFLQIPVHGTKWGATMARSITAITALFAACVFGAAAAPTLAQAQNCERGALDDAYSDAAGDMVADTPADPKQRVNPSVLVFAYTPVEDPAVYGKVWDGFIKHMEKTTGKKVVFFPVQSNAAEIEAMRSGRLHVAGFNTGSNPIAVNCAGFVPIAIMGGKNAEFGYEMEIIVPADSAAKSPADLKGKKLAFTEPTSNSGFKAPSALLKADFNLEKDRDFTAMYSDKHDNSVIGVANKDNNATAIANKEKNRKNERKVVDKAKIRTIYKSETFPTTGYGYAHNLD